MGKSVSAVTYHKAHLHSAQNHRKFLVLVRSAFLIHNAQAIAVTSKRPTTTVPGCALAILKTIRAVNLDLSAQMNRLPSILHLYVLNDICKSLEGVAALDLIVSVGGALATYYQIRQNACAIPHPRLAVIVQKRANL